MMRGCGDRRHADEPGAVLLGRVARAFLLVRGAALAADRVAHHLRLRRRAARQRRRGAACRAPPRGLRREDADARGDARRVAAERSRQRHRDQLAVVREHGVGVGDLEQRRRQAVAVAHRRLLDRPPALVRAQPPGDRAGEAELRLLAEADRAVELPHLARRELSSPSRTAPTLLDFWITSLTVRSPCGCESVIVEPVSVILPRRGLDHGRRRDAAGLERPGGNERLHRRAGLEGVGQGAVAQLRAGQVACGRTGE